MHKKILRLFQKRYLAFVMLVVIAFAVFGVDVSRLDIVKFKGNDDKP